MTKQEKGYQIKILKTRFKKFQSKLVKFISQVKIRNSGRPNLATKYVSGMPTSLPLKTETTAGREIIAAIISIFFQLGDKNLPNEKLIF